jgi:hypothetical protein
MRASHCATTPIQCGLVDSPGRAGREDDLAGVARLFHGGQPSRAGDVNKWLETGSEPPQFGETVLRPPLRSLNVLAELQRERFLVLKP